jgi:hypothetical protein
MSTALGIVLAVAAMPAAADWKNFFVQTNPASTADAPYIPDTVIDPELPIDLPDPITELNDLPPPDLGELPPPSDLPLTVITQLDSTPQTSSVPEPGTISLFALALLGMGLSMAYRRQRKERAAR